MRACPRFAKKAHSGAREIRASVPSKVRPRRARPPVGRFQSRASFDTHQYEREVVPSEGDWTLACARQVSREHLGASLHRASLFPRCLHASESIFGMHAGCPDVVQRRDSLRDLSLSPKAAPTQSGSLCWVYTVLSAWNSLEPRTRERTLCRLRNLGNLRSLAAPRRLALIFWPMSPVQSFFDCISRVSTLLPPRKEAQERVVGKRRAAKIKGRKPKSTSGGNLGRESRQGPPSPFHV